jgi:membrane protein DedA with SNARE-associated domain
LPLTTAFLISSHQINHLLGRWGYGLVFLVVLLQSAGVPVPGTTALAAAAVYAGTTHRLAIVGVILAALLGAIGGQCVGFALGRWGGWSLLKRHGHRVGLTPSRLKVGRYVFMVHGGKVVFFARFVTGLRNWAGFLAGANRMAVRQFMFFNFLGALTWSLWNGLGYYYFGHALATADAPVSVTLAVLAVGSFVVTAWYLRRRGRGIVGAAERAFPGPLD